MPNTPRDSLPDCWHQSRGSCFTVFVLFPCKIYALGDKCKIILLSLREFCLSGIYNLVLGPYAELWLTLGSASQGKMINFMCILSISCLKETATGRAENASCISWVMVVNTSFLSCYWNNNQLKSQGTDDSDDIEGYPIILGWANPKILIGFCVKNIGKNVLLILIS